MARREIDPQFGSYMHIAHLPRQDEALLLLKKLASVVKPIMRKRNWKVGELAEFLPPQWNLLGLNVNRGQTIFVRLRHGADPKQFLPYDALIETMLHDLEPPALSKLNEHSFSALIFGFDFDPEILFNHPTVAPKTILLNVYLRLSHIQCGPHDKRFHKLWDELREEYYALKRQGYTGEGFLGHGQKVGGGKAVPLNEVRRQARAAAEKRKTVSAGPGHRLGGAPVPRGSDMRQVIADAAERRNKITQGCGSGDHVVERKAEEEARRLGFRTKADMDDADKLAIAIAMMEGDRDAHQQDMRELGTSQEGLSWSPERGLEMTGVQNNNALSATSIKPASSPTHAAASRSSVSTPRPGRPVSRLVAGKSAGTQTGGRPEVVDLTADSPKREKESQASTWTCEICTLINQMQHLCCDACGVERPESVSERISMNSQGQAPPVPPRPRPRPLGWNCTRCGAFMEDKWWTCSACGLMKASS